MSKVAQITLFTLVTIFLFGLLTLPGLASEPKTPLLPVKNMTTSSVNPLKPAMQMTFTPVATIYLSFLTKPATPANDLEITNLSPSGSDEIVQIRNNGPNVQSMNDWQLVSVVGPQTFDFPNGITLGVGQTIRIHSGPDAVNKPPTDLLWTTAFVWLNSGDKAELRDDQGQVRDTSCYGSGCP